MKKIFIIGGGEMQVPVIQKAKSLGYYCIVSDFNPNAPGFEYADVKINISTTDVEKTLRFAREYEIDGILTTSDYPVRTVAYVCENLGLNGLDLEAAKKCTDKFAQREALEACGFNVPKHFRASFIEEINANVDRLTFPLIVKPIDSSASRGVKKVTSYEDLIIAFNEAIMFSYEKTVIIEEFIEGPEFSVESLTQYGETHVIAITEKGLGQEKNCFVESSHIIPADLDPDNEITIINYVKEIIRGLNLNNTSTHAELKLTSNGPVLIEIGARLGGDFITSDLVPLSTGIDMLENAINIAINEPIKIIPTKEKYSGIRFLDNENYERGVDLINSNNSNIIKCELKPFKGTPITNSLDRLGYIIATSDKRVNLMSLLKI